MEASQKEKGEILEEPGTNFFALGAIIARHGPQNVSTELKYAYLQSAVESGHLTKEKARQIAKGWNLDLWGLSQS